MPHKRTINDLHHVVKHATIQARHQSCILRQLKKHFQHPCGTIAVTGVIFEIALGTLIPARLRHRQTRSSILERSAPHTAQLKTGCVLQTAQLISP